MNRKDLMKYYGSPDNDWICAPNLWMIHMIGLNVYPIEGLKNFCQDEFGIDCTAFCFGLHGFIGFDADEWRDLENEENPTFPWLMLHEYGHFAGLKHSTDINNFMHPNAWLRCTWINSGGGLAAEGLIRPKLKRNWLIFRLTRFITYPILKFFPGFGLWLYRRFL